MRRARRSQKTSRICRERLFCLHHGLRCARRLRFGFAKGRQKTLRSRQGRGQGQKGENERQVSRSLQCSPGNRPPGANLLSRHSLWSAELPDTPCPSRCDRCHRRWRCDRHRSNAYRPDHNDDVVWAPIHRKGELLVSGRGDIRKLRAPCHGSRVPSSECPCNGSQSLPLPSAGVRPPRFSRQR